MLTLKQMADYTNGNIICGNKDIVINEFSLLKDNTRYENYFYIPITFKGINREHFILDHVRNKCIGFMISKNNQEKEEIEEKAKKINPNICILEVDSVNNALYELGKLYRERNINKPIIAVTGSVGKTTLCSLISKVLSTEKKVLHDFNNENNNTKSHISLSYLYLDNYEMAVTEVGISDFRMMSTLSELIKPSIAVINFIGTAHLNNFLSKENILKEKLHITDYLKDDKLLFVNKDCEYLKNLSPTSNYNIIRYGRDEAYDIVEDSSGIKFKTKIYDKAVSFDLKLYGEYNISNIILAIKIGQIYNISFDNIKNAIANFESVSGRLKIYKNNKNNITLIDDSYSSSYESAVLGLNTANKIESKRKIAILGKMAAYGESANYYHEKLGEFFNNLHFNYLYLTGDYTKHIFKGALSYFDEKDIKKFKNKDLLLATLEKNIKNGDLIYAKAANTQNFDEIIKYLIAKFNLS